MKFKLKGNLIYISFNNHEFTFNTKHYKSLIYNEILPGIYFKTSKNYAYFKIKNNLYSLRIIHNHEIKFENYPNYTSKQLAYFSRFCGTKTHSKFEEVDLSKIISSNNMGGGMNRCHLQFIPYIFNSNNHSFELFSLSDMVDLSNSSPYISNYCKIGYSCREKISDFKRECCTQNGDCVELMKLGDSYFISNGNHRVCCSKKTNLKTIPAKVSYFLERDNLDLSNYASEYSYNKFQHGSTSLLKGYNLYNDPNEVVNSFYKNFNRLNINKRCAKKIMKNNIQGIELIKLIEIKNNNTIDVIFEEIRNNTK